MKKTVTLRCPTCGNTYTFNVGAGSEMSCWREISALIPDKKEAEKLKEIYVKLSEKRSKAAISELTRNHADALGNVCYSDLGEDVVKLLSEEQAEEYAALLNDKAKESVASSVAKWQAALQKEGLTAFEAIYICPKSRKPKQGMHVSHRYKDDNRQDNVYVVKNKCDDCSAAPVLADDGGAGFMHEGCVTSAYCDKCSVPLVIDSVSFRIAQKENPEA